MPDTFRHHWRRFVARPVQAGLTALAVLFFGLLPLDWASAIGGWLGRTIGPHTGMSRRAWRNLQRAFPDKPPPELDTIVRDMWDNLGRVAAEYPHVTRLTDMDGDSRIEVIGAEHVEKVRESGKSGIFFSAHVGNWELFAPMAKRHGVPVAVIYRAPNNLLVDMMIRRFRLAGATELLRKGPEGARRAIKVLREQRHLGILVDQKMNDGIAVPFFGRDAMTAPALAQLALRFDCFVIPVRIERVKGARFRITVLPPMQFSPRKDADRQAETLAIMTRVNAIIEEWIRERPAQWLWMHRRWPE